MSVVQHLSDLATEIADEMQQRRSVLEAELLKLESRKREIDADIRATDLGRERLSHFQVSINGEYQCPNCWVRHEIKSPLTAVPSDTKDDFFRCDRCGCETLVDWPEAASD
jgi:hypothetical protein